MIFPCQECQQFYDDWTTYQAPITKWINQGPVARSTEIYHAKAKEHYELINQQCDLKKASCRAKGCLLEVAA